MNFDKYIYELYNNEDSEYDEYDYEKYRRYSEWKDCKEWKGCKDHKECPKCPKCRKHDKKRVSTSIIPFASGAPISLPTAPPNLHQVMAAIAFGNQSPVVADPATRDIILTPPQTPPALNMAFSMPRFGIIRSIAAYFSITTPVTIPTGTIVTVRAQLYQSTAPNDTFTPIAGTLVTLVPSFSGALIPGNRAHAILENLKIPVRPETRLLLVFSAVASPNTTIVTLVGHASAGISIE
jgi:BclB C-terminal domain-containing protein